MEQQKQLGNHTFLENIKIEKNRIFRNFLENIFLLQHVENCKILNNTLKPELSGSGSFLLRLRLPLRSAQIEKNGFVFNFKIETKWKF